jgi:TolB protein
MHPDGTSQRRLTNSRETEQSPLWSPDGTKIAFATGRHSSVRDNYIMDGMHIYVMNADGSSLKRLASGSVSLPAWSPDSTKLVFSTYRSYDREDYVISADGINQVLLNSLKKRGEVAGIGIDGGQVGPPMGR